MTDGLPLHPACEALPELSLERFAELVESIREHGLEDPIIIHDGMVLDGRHRMRACAEAGVEPRFEEWDGRGGDPIGFIALKQIRRDMTTSQRAAWAAEYVLPVEEEKAAERKAEGGRVRHSQHVEAVPDAARARDRAGEAAGVSGRSVGEAKKIRESDSALFDAVKKGDLSLAEAARQQKLAEKVAAFPDDERDRASTFLGGVIEDGNHSAKALELADNLLSMPDEDRARIYVLNESEDERERQLARTEAAKLPPMPHPALPHLRDAKRSLARAEAQVPVSERLLLRDMRKQLEDVISTLKEDVAA